MENIIFLNKEDVLDLHKESIRKYGGDDGILSHGLLESAIFSASSSMGGKFLNEFPYEMAASYFFSICQNHAFVDGNKRTAVAAALVFLFINDIDVRLNELDLYNLTFDIASGKKGKHDIKLFLATG